ncbi:MAG: hypothetical protein JWM98_1274 [Thermoleophilia bacterium]|nr:hypothetical protein [Thermoleophilia bacterium]
MIEMIIVMVIIAVLIAGAWMAMRSAKSSARARAMTTAAASVDEAIGAYNRMYPPVAAGSDPLWQRAPGAVWTGNTGTAALGLADETGEWILNEWPANPYASGGVKVSRYASDASCTSGQPGEVHVCRAVAGTMTYHVVAWAKDTSDATIKVYDMSHGTK